MNKRILITGATGQLGRSAVEELQQYFEILSTARHIPAETLTTCPVVEMDIRNKTIVQQVVSKYEPDVLIHLAAMTDVDGCERKREEAWQINVKGTEHLLESIAANDTRIIFLSTDYLFDGTQGPYREDAKPSPINYYGKTKLAAENAIRGGRNPWVILRTNVLYGAGESSASFVRWVNESLSVGKEIRVVDDQMGNPTWTGALAEAIKLLIVMNSEGLFHYGGADYLSRYQFALKIADVFDLDTSLIKKISTLDLKQDAMRPLKGGLITEKIEETIGVRTYKLGYCLRKVKEGVNA
ncbi:MAG: dTDP-4-dehydrorhamnose reductase [Fidelibacterota bacterium]